MFHLNVNRLRARKWAVLAESSQKPPGVRILLGLRLASCILARTGTRGLENAILDAVQARTSRQHARPCRTKPRRTQTLDMGSHVRGSLLLGGRATQGELASGLERSLCAGQGLRPDSKASSPERLVVLIPDAMISIDLTTPSTALPHRAGSINRALHNDPPHSTPQSGSFPKLDL